MVAMVEVEEVAAMTIMMTMIMIMHLQMDAKDRLIASEEQ
jgi:hypothetical protein